MKLGILGTGKIVKDFLPAVKTIGLEKIYLFATERSRDTAEALKNEYALNGCYFSYDDLLASDIDTVYIALPNNLHHTFAKKALLAGKNVIVEKPATVNYAELLDLIDTAKSRSKFLFEAMTIHYTPAFISAREDLAKLGDIRIVSMNYSQYSSRYDAFKNGHILPAFDPKKAGGALMDINVYNLHVLAGLFGKPEAADYHANVQRGIDTSGIMILDYGTFKAVCIGAKDCAAPASSTIQGDKGSIIFHAPANQILGYTLRIYGQDDEEKSFDPDTHRMIYEFREFIRMIDENAHAEADEKMRVSEIIAELIETTRKKEGIYFDGEK